MTAQEVINCAPWRLSQPRPLTPYEWTVVENAIHEGVVSAAKVPSTTTKQASVALTMAISTQRACPTWTHSAFGPAPAVSTYAYGCLGSWWGALDPLSQGRVITDISGGLLCHQPVPWAHCPLGQRGTSWSPVSRSEYGAQRGILAPGAPAAPCVITRQRTVYTPLTGKELNELMRVLGGGVVPAELSQLMRSGGQLFANTSFLVGWQLRSNVNIGALQSLATPQDLLKLLDAALEEVVVVTAPGKGVSIRQMVVTGTVDPAKLIAILQQIDPSAWGDLMQNLPGWLQQQLPGLLQQAQLPGLDLGALMGALGGNVQHKLVSNARMPDDTGYSVVDQPGEAQSDDATNMWAQIEHDYMMTRIYWLGIGVVLTGAFFYDAYRRRQGTLAP
jgi:hypothetical protein